jgi:hypothetical protein
MLDYLPLSEKKAIACKKLAEFAGRIATLLESPEVQSRPSLQASLDDLLGGVYSLIYATHHDYTDRPQTLSSDDIRNVLRRAKEMSNLRVRSEGKWTAGFYFNNALFRISAVYHRVLKTLSGRDKERLHIPDLLPIAEKLFKSAQSLNWSNTSVKKIHREVNDLKHTPAGIYEGRRVKFDEAVQALDEVLGLIEVLVKENPSHVSRS